MSKWMLLMLSFRVCQLCYIKISMLKLIFQTNVLGHALKVPVEVVVVVVVAGLVVILFGSGAGAAGVSTTVLSADALDPTSVMMS